MTAVVTNIFAGIISTADLDSFKLDLQYCIANLTNTIVVESEKGLQCDCEITSLEWLLSCQQAINNWVQNDDGTIGVSDNYISQTQFNAIISSCKNICGCSRASIPAPATIPTVNVLPFLTNTQDFIQA